MAIEEARSQQKWSYKAGTSLVATAFLVSGLTGLMSGKLAKVDYHHCYYVVMERFCGGADLNPTAEALEASYIYFNFVFHLHRLLLVALSFIIVQEQKMEAASSLGSGLLLLDLILFSNPMMSAEYIESTHVLKHLLKQLALIGICFMLKTHGKDPYHRPLQCKFPALASQVADFVR
jgi:hypothetical protein